MNRHGERFITARNFRSYANSLNVGWPSDSELEFYEQHCLLLPAARVHRPTAYVIAAAEMGSGVPITNPEDLTSPEALRRLQLRHADGLHSFDAERGRNPFLVTPDCATFEPWDAGKVAVTGPDRKVRRHPAVERYYHPWQVHVLELLLRQKYYYVHSRFLRHLDPAHELQSRYRLPDNTEEIRSLRGMAAGFDALERFLYADQAALNEAFDGMLSGESLSKPARDQLRTVLTDWAQRALEMSGVAEPAFFEFLGRLVGLINEYRADERIALAEDAEQYLLDAQALAGYAFGHDWDSFLASAERHRGPALVAGLRRLDPVDAAADDARENLRFMVGAEPLASIAGRGTLNSVPDEIVAFCQENDLFEVLRSLQHESFTDDDQRRDRFPGFLNRRLRPLALAVEQLLRALLEVESPCSHTPHQDDCPHNKTLRPMVQILGRDSAWLPHFKPLKTGDGAGDLAERSVERAVHAATPGIDRDQMVANTLAAAVGTRNLVSHRSRFLPTREAERLGDACARAVVLVWFEARESSRRNRRSHGSTRNGSPSRSPPRMVSPSR